MAQNVSVTAIPPPRLGSVWQPRRALAAPGLLQFGAPKAWPCAALGMSTAERRRK